MRIQAKPLIEKPRHTMRKLPQPSKWMIFVATASLAACSIHPIPDDVSRYSTEEIVRNVRCEAKEAVRQRIMLGLHKAGLDGINPDTVLVNKSDFAKIQRAAPDLAKKFVAYGASTIAYTFDFMIDETNDNSGAVGFNIPFGSGGNFSLGLDGGLHKARTGHRNFKTVEHFSDLVRLDCDIWARPDRNFVYPLTGSIGVAKIIDTFINVSELGGGQGDFSDTITFTTRIHGSVKPELVLEPVANRFRLVSANADLGSERKDVHEVTIALSFPEIDLRRVHSGRAVRASLAELSDDARVRALENMCITNARSREDRFGTLRLTAPEEYCRRGAASFSSGPE